MSIPIHSPLSLVDRLRHASNDELRRLTRFANTEIARNLSQAAGVGTSVITKLRTSNRHMSVQTDLARLRDAPMLPDDMVVG
jgi:multidrug efflux pump subunit AcrB